MNYNIDEIFLKYEFALQTLLNELNILIKEYEFKNKTNPVEHIKSRIKTKESAFDKLKRKGYPSDLENMILHVHDMVGVRLVCSFKSDVYDIVNIIKNSKSLTIKKEQDFKGIRIKVIDKHQYMDYTVLDIEVQNNSNFQVLMDDLENIKSVYIQDDNDGTYNLYTHEIAKNELLVLPKQSKKIKLKFYSKYISSKKIKRIVFSNVILNFRANDIEERMKCSIEI